MTQSTIHLTGGDFERLAHFRHMKSHAIEDENVLFTNATIFGSDGLRLCQPRADFRLYALKERLEFLEILTSRALCDLFCGELSRSCSHVFQRRNFTAVRISSTQGFQKFIIGQLGGRRAHSIFSISGSVPAR